MYPSLFTPHTFLMREPLKQPPHYTATDASLLALPFPCTLEYDSHTIIGDLKVNLCIYIYEGTGYVFLSGAALCLCV